jgi:hypothetical protein
MCIFDRNALLTKGNCQKYEYEKEQHKVQNVKTCKFKTEQNMGS